MSFSRWRHKLQEARAYLKAEGPKETSRHARVSLDNKHSCHSCFCCACVEVLSNFGYEPSTGEKKLGGDNPFRFEKG